ncbi:MAG: sensor histidine kinase, partial [Acidobacteriota bacterium]
GFDPRAQLGAVDHFGLLGMQERADRMGGRLAMRSRPGRGTEIEVVVPLPGPRAGKKVAGGAT